MAGDWIPYELALPTKGKVVQITRLTGAVDYDQTCGRLCRFWGWASNETVDGHLPGLTVADLCLIHHLDPVFWEAMIAVGWLVVLEGGLFVPRAEEWITKGAKARLQKNRRQAKWRDGDVDGRASTKASTTEQNSTEHTLPTCNEQLEILPPSELVAKGGAGGISSRRPAKKCPPDIVLTVPMMDFALNEGLSEPEAQREFAKMRDHTFATARSDWAAVWRNWVRGAKDRLQPRQGSQTAAQRTMSNVREFLRESK